MKNQKQTLHQLRELIHTQFKWQQPTFLPCQNYPPGFPQGRLSAIYGPKKTEFVVHFLAEHTNFRVAWIENEMSIYPFAMEQRHACLKRILFIEAHQDLPWAALQVLNSKIFPIVIIQSSPLPTMDLRKLQLAAEKSMSVVIFLLEKPRQKKWPIALQIPTPMFELSLLK